MLYSTDQIVKDVPLVHVDGDERLKLGPVHFGEVARGLGDELVEELQEGLVGGLHHLTVGLGHCQGVCGISGPHDLDA